MFLRFIMYFHFLHHKGTYYYNNIKILIKENTKYSRIFDIHQDVLKLNL